jgi:uncharacterized protein (DUF1501 family)
MSEPRLPSGPAFSRRSFLVVTAGGLVALALPGCASGGSPSSSAATAVGGGSGTAADVGGARALIVVELDGGNDGLSAVVPADGRYRDARPTIAVPEKDVVALTGTTEVGLHPALAPLVPLWDAGRLSAVRGVGFPDPDRSHFVSMDRWWKADRGGAAPGWLADWLDSAPDGSGPLTATSVNGSAPQLAGSGRAVTTLIDPAGFDFRSPALADGLRALADDGTGGGGGGDDLVSMARAAMARSVDAVADVQGLVTAAGNEDDLQQTSPFTAGLALAAEIVAAATGPTVVVVSGGSFDTHSGQVATHQRLYADVAAGIAGYFTRAESGGFAERSLLMTTSEFGRRVAENGSGGTDHGAASTTFLAGPAVAGGLHGAIDLGDLLDGDVRPTMDPRTIYTAALDWLGADVEAALGRRYDEVALLQS